MNRMNKKGATTGEIVIMFIGIIVCVALFGTIIDGQNQATSKLVEPNETRDLTACYGAVGDSGVFQVNETIAACNFTVVGWYPTGDWRASHSACELGSVVVSDGVDSELTLNTDYNLYAGDGIIQFLNTTDTDDSNGNDTFFTYNRCGEGYNVDSGARGVALMWTIFAALALFAFVIWAGIKNEWWLS